MQELRNPRRNSPLRERRRDALSVDRSSDADSDAVDADDAENGGTVEVVWGANMDSLDVGGMTVDEVRHQLDNAYNIAPDALVTVNGVAAPGDRRLRAGDCLEFVRAAGEKGDH